MSATSAPPPSLSDVHPSAIGSATQPDTNNSSAQPNTSASRIPTAGMGSDSNTNAPTSSNSLDAQSSGGDDYPEQKHAGAVGYGPNYNQGASFTDKITGIKQQVIGKITKNPGLVEQGRERMTGELKHKELEDDNDPFATADKGKGEKQTSATTEVQPQDRSTTSTNEEGGDKERAVTIAPEGAQQASNKQKGEAVEGVKYT